MKDVVGYEGYYAIDEEGNVFSLRTHKKMKPFYGGAGYHQLNLSVDKKRKKVYVHRLMAEAYLPDFCEELTVDHIDRDKTNNKLSNLRMATKTLQQLNSDTSGVRFTHGKYRARITYKGKELCLGNFDTYDAAHRCYLSKKHELLQQELSNVQDFAQDT